MAIYTKREMNTGRYIRTIILILALFIGATNEAWALSQADIIFDPASPEGGTVAFKSIDGQTVTITVTPGEGFYVKISDIIVQKLQDPSQAQARRRTPAIADRLAVTGAQESEVAADYTFEIPTGYAGALVTVAFTSKIAPGYYVLHNEDKGYLKVGGANVTFSSDNTFRSGNLFGDGNSIWYINSNGYLQNEYYYLNVANNKTLYISVTPVTKWRTEDIENKTKKHLKINDGTNDLYLCNDNNSITLKPSPTNYYNACPVTVEEVAGSWTGPTADKLTLQSPQLVTYLRAYFTQKIKYSFINDKGDAVASTDGKHERRVYATIAYKEGGTGTSGWAIDVSGVLYNTKSSGDVEFTATYNLLPADPVAKATHSTPATKDITYKVQQKVTLSNYDENMDYLLFSIPEGDNYRYPYDDGTLNNGDPVKPNGKGGTGSDSKLYDPLSDGSGRNREISWKITVDAEGFYTFQNSSTNKYLYFDDTPHASSDYGTLSVSDAPSGNSAKFRLYKPANDANYGTCYYIIPYSKLFAVYKSDGIADGLYAALNIKDYSSKSTKVISLFKPNGNSTWCIYKYEAEYRVRQDFAISGPTTAVATGDYEFSSVGWYGKYIKESPKTGSAQRGLEIMGSYKNENNIDYLWTVKGLGSNTDISGGTLNNDNGTWTITTNNRKLVINVTSIPVSTISGVIELKLSGCSAPNENVVTTNDNGKKTFAFTILGNGTVEWIDISSLSMITSSSGAYRLTADVSDRPGVTNFAGILEGNGHTISGLTAPLFETITNGTVRNVNLTGVNISSHAGPTGAIAGTADGGSRIYNVGILDGSVGSSGKCGGIVGKLDGSARVINCFSYANITGGSDVGGIVGYNNYASKSGDIRTMVMNCMFYGDITGGTTISPVYGGYNINNITHDSDRNSDGLNTFNYYAYDRLKTMAISDNKYNCALAVEEKYLNRFEFYRLLLNSNKKLAAFYATGSVDNGGQMLKWVLETADRTIDTPKPYPILKAQGYYPSIINPDIANAPDSATVGRNHGGKLGKTLSVTISGTKTDGGQTWPTGANIATTSLTLTRTDKDFDRYNYNYDKVQLPYYNDVGTGNYTGNRVVTGWKITAIDAVEGDPYTDANYDYSKDYSSDQNYFDYPNYNFADRKSSNKDLYSVSGRVFSQGAYFDVPYGVTSITIEPYWGKAVYLADANYDVVYKNDYSGKQDVTQTGTQVEKSSDGKSTITWFDGQKVETSIERALNYIGDTTTGLGGLGPTVYDNALVLLGNYHLNTVPQNGVNHFTMMSVDMDNDHEPDYSLIYHHIGRSNITPIRFDFLAVPGTAQAQKPNGASLICNFTIFKTRGWFEVTNTAFMYSSQVEYENGDLGTGVTKINAPLILLGGIFDQFVSTQSSAVNGKTIYIHVGSNVLINSFGLGTHSDGKQSTPHVPVSVTGGEFPGFYLTGTYNQNATERTDNAECYVSGGYFKELAGASQEPINGDVRWQIYNADIDEFFGGGTNDAKPIKGNVTVNIYNSHVTTYCGGPKFGNMQTGKKVTTNAEGCAFGKYFGAGYGGLSYSRKKYYDNTTPAWGTTLQGYYTTDRGKYFDGNTTGLGSNAQYGYKGPGVATDFDYEFFVWSSGATGGRFFVKFASFSLAQCNDVDSKLKNCTIENNFYGGGSLGKVVGTVTSELDNCTVKGNVFGAGFSASIDPVEVRDAGFTTNPNYNSASGMFEPGVFSGTTTFTWRNISDAGADGTNLSIVQSGNNKGKITNNTSGSNLTKHYIYTDVDISNSNLGSVDGDVTLTIKGNSVIGTAGDISGEKGNVFGGGESSYVTGAAHTVTVNLQGNTEVLGNVFGGGDEGVVEGTAIVNIGEIPTSTSGSGSGSGGDEPGGGSGD